MRGGAVNAGPGGRLVPAGGARARGGMGCGGSKAAGAAGAAAGSEQAAGAGAEQAAGARAGAGAGGAEAGAAPAPAGDLDGYDEGWDALVRAPPGGGSPARAESPDVETSAPARRGLADAEDELRKSQRVLSIAGRDFMDDVSDDSGTEEEPGTALRPREARAESTEAFGEDGEHSPARKTPRTRAEAPGSVEARTAEGKAQTLELSSPQGGGEGAGLLESSFDAPSPGAPRVERLALDVGPDAVDEASLMLPDSSPARPRSPGQQPFMSPAAAAPSPAGARPGFGSERSEELPGSPAGADARAPRDGRPGGEADILNLAGAPEEEEELDLVEHGEFPGEAAFASGTVPPDPGAAEGDEEEEEEEDDDVFDSAAISSLVNHGVEGGNWEEDDVGPRDSFDVPAAAANMSEDAAWAHLQSGYGEESPEFGQAPPRHDFRERVLDAEGDGYAPPDLGELHSDLPSAKWALGGGEEGDDGGAFGDLLAAKTLDGPDSGWSGPRARSSDVGMGLEDIEDLDDGFGLPEPAPLRGFTPTGVEAGGGLPQGPAGADSAFDDKFDDFEAKFAAMSPA